MTETCPRIEQLSASLDDELRPPEQALLAVHLRDCRACANALARMRMLRAELRELPSPPLPIDLSGIIEARIAQMPKPGARPSAVPASSSAWWRRTPRSVPSGALGSPSGLRWLTRALPAGLAAALSLSLGLAIGLRLDADPTNGSDASSLPQVSAMAVFDPVAPGGVCIGLAACYGAGAMR